MALVGQLIILEGKDAGKKHILDKRHVFEIGRASSSVIKLDDASVAMNHCRIYREEGNQYTIFDLNSAIGTHVNGQKVQSLSLKTGDKIKIGNVFAEFKLSDIQIKDETDDDVESFSLFSNQWAEEDGSVKRSEEYVETAKQDPQPVAKATPAPAVAAGPKGRLTALEGEDKGKEFLIDQEGQYMIGRAMEAQIKIMDIKASRAHCLVERVGNQFFVADNASRNGTYLNGQKMEPNIKMSLLPDARIKVGFTVFKFDIV